MLALQTSLPKVVFGDRHNLFVSWHNLFVLYGGTQIRSPNRTNGEVDGVELR